MWLSNAKEHFSGQAYLATYGRQIKMQDLPRQALADEFDDSLWQNWFIHRKDSFVKSTANMLVRDGVLAIQLALDGQAIALAGENLWKTSLPPAH